MEKLLNYLNWVRNLRSFFYWLKEIPVALGGAALSLSTIGLLWSHVKPEYEYLIDPLSLLVPISFLLIIVLRFLVYPDLLYRELSDSLIGSTLPAVGMAIMSVAGGLLSRMPVFSPKLWLIGVGLNFIFVMIFLLRQLKSLTLSAILPSWFMLPVGLGFASMTGTEMGYDNLNQILVTTCALGYLILLPLLIVRLVYYPSFSVNEKPTVAIFSAPPNLILAGYITNFDTVRQEIVFFLMPYALLMTTLVYITFYKLIQRPFYTTHVLLNFPAVVSAAAMIIFASWLEEHDYHSLGYFTGIIGDIELAIATTIVAYISCHFLFYAVRVFRK